MCLRIARSHYRIDILVKASGSVVQHFPGGPCSAKRISGSCGEEDNRVVLILIRQDTVPEDIREISMAEGLLTARGGQTSHASVVATRLEKTCVVGCRDLQVYETREYAKINGHRINFGDPISIDGRSGLFIKGIHPVQEEVHILPL